jgi:hypothetical protein
VARSNDLELRSGGIFEKMPEKHTSKGPWNKIAFWTSMKKIGRKNNGGIHWQQNRSAKTILNSSRGKLLK